jgi:hypothetical protein
MCRAKFLSYGQQLYIQSPAIGTEPKTELSIFICDHGAMIQLSAKIITTFIEN